jgi:ATP-dependent DNA helicase RecG
MLTDQKLDILLKDIESDRVERAVRITSSEKLCEAICAFANDLPDSRQPGVFFVGANDDGTLAQITITDQLLRELSGQRERITPFPIMIVQKRRLTEGDVAVVIVEPSFAPPVRFKGRVWIRVGPSRRIASPEEERLLIEKRRSRDLSYELTLVQEANLNDLDLDFFEKTYLPNLISPDILEQNQRNLDQQLASVRFIGSIKQTIPTVLGLLAIGNDPSQFISGAYVQFLRFDGVGLADPIKDEKRISGNIASLLRQLDEVLKINISTETDLISADTEIKRPDYPLPALQQIVRNAVLHRVYEGTNAPSKIFWFTDRVEIYSPGGPYGQVTKENFGQGLADYRNPNLAEVMKTLGYVQRFGVGIQIAKQELSKNGNPQLEFSVENTNVAVIVRKHP